ncbi:MAG TPA: aspartate-semialdehyde dehydrogenase [Gammaproteobacteria bacterium]|nr:aspartate-semialdehyde dehydrogenase [Gammaproteobacteria bacterium]
MTATVDLAVVGCTSLVGESILEVLAASTFPLGRLYLLDNEAAAGRKVEFRERYLVVESLASFDFGKVRLALFATSGQLAAEWAPKAAAAGCSVVDSSGHFRQREAVPLVVAEVNPEQLQRLPAGAIVASPSPAAVVLTLALKPLQQAAGIERIDATVCYPASTAGRAGVEELASQAAQLLNAREVKARTFPKQLAFNLLPQVGNLLADGSSDVEADVVAEMRRLLGAELAIGISAIQVPVFYGLAAVVHLQTHEPLTLADARALLAAEPGLEVVDDSAESGFPTPVTEAAQQDKVFVGRLREDGSRSRSLNFWIVADNVRKGAAINTIQLAEHLVRGNR